MTSRIHPVGRAVLAVLGSISLTLLLAFVVVEPVLAAHVQPITVTGNPTCGSLGTWTEVLRVDPVESDTYTASNGAEIEITVRSTSDGQVFDWTSDMSINGVFAKGGNEGNLYDYGDSGSLGDTGLHAPVNPSGDWAGLSHVSFCALSSTSTTEGPTTTVAPTSTEAPTTTASPTTTGDVSDTSQTTTTTIGNQVQETTTSTVEDQVLGTTITTSSTSTTIEDEVLDTEVLPFTGFGGEGFGMLALAIVSAGVLFLVAGRSIEH